LNEIKRYDQELAEQLAQIPLPDENFAWAEMKKMLDEDEDDPVIIPFYRRFGCGLLGLAGLLLLSAGGWFYYQKTKKENIVQAADLPGGNNTGKVKTAGVVGNSTGMKDSTTASARKNDPGNIDPAPFLPSQQKEVLNDASITRLTSNSKTTMQFRGPGFEENNTELPVKRRNNNRTLKGKTTLNIRPAITTGEETIITDETSGENSSYSDPGKIRAAIQIPAVDSVITAIKKDSSLIVKKDSPVISKKTEATTLQEKDPGKNSWLLGAGLTVYQPFSLNGESAVPYNRYGRKGSLSDYIPSAYFRVYRNKKWFLHTEFRYGAPQSVKPFYYKQDIMIDSSQSVIRSVYQLKKTYYHQVPLSFHYYVLPGLSLGTGVIYNRFGGAVANQDVYRGNNGAVDTLISSGIVSDPDKSRFVKNHFQWSAEAQYQWKRISLGARYSRDINPYIKFTDFITGESVEKKAETFNIFIRYELWRKR
jgi:hypothetical protein